TGADNDPRHYMAGSLEFPRAISNDRTGFRSDEVNALFKQARAASSVDGEKKAYNKVLELAEAQVRSGFAWGSYTPGAATKYDMLREGELNRAGGIPQFLASWSLR